MKTSHQVRTSAARVLTSAVPVVTSAVRVLTTPAVPVVASVLVVASALATSTPTAAQNPPVTQTQEGITLNFQNVDLASVITALGQAAGINVAAANMPDVPVTLRTAEPVPPEEVEALIRQLAVANSVTITEEGGFLVLQGPTLEDGVIQEPRFLYIHQLRYARAGMLAATLQALFGGAIPVANTGQTPQTLSQQLQTLEQQALPAPGVAVGAQGQAFEFQVGAGELEGDVQIVPDELTNTLLVRARVDDWAIIEQAIQALDLRPLQVVIEVVIAEVQTRDELNLGVSFLASHVDEQTGAFTDALLPGDEPTGFSLRFFRMGDIDVDATLQALSAQGDVRIVSRPIIQVQNNQEARILVGSERPFVQVSQVLATDQGTVNEVIQYRDVGTSLNILPTINEDGYVNLFLTQEVSSATAEIQFGAPVISTREATTQILARTGQTVVIGGLVEQQTSETKSGIPLLKDIPLLGYLFGSTRELVTNSELFLFLTPFVVASDDDAERLRLEIEENVELLRELVPIPSVLPPAPQTIVPDTIGG